MDSYKRFVINVAELRALYDEILTVRETCAVLARETRNMQWIALGTKVTKIQTDFAQNLDQIAKLVAVNSQKMIVASLRSKLVRPPTGIHPGLEDVIWCTPVSTGPFSFGQVELAWVSKLDEAVNPEGGVLPYWRAQEFGYSGNLGRRLFGTFSGGAADAMPTALQFRQHAVFTFGDGPNAGLGTITRPIPAKHFLRDGTDEAETQWLAMTRTAVQAAVLAIRDLALP